MKRLKQKLLQMEPDTCTYKAMYEGAMTVVPTNDKEPWREFDSTYYDNDISFTFELTHKLVQDKPTVIIHIPIEKHIVSDMGFIFIGDELIDIRGLHDIITKRQLDALGYMLRYLEIRNTDRKPDIDARIEELFAEIEKNGLDTVFSSFFTTTERFLDLPRKQELKAVINRMRKTTVRADS